MQSADAVATLAAAGQIEFGENYVQEAQRKIAALQAGLSWHLIGPLQSNKAKLASNCFDWIDSVHSLKLAELLSLHRAPEKTPLKVLLQVNIDREPQKHGVQPEQVEALVPALLRLPQLEFRGLMAIPKPDQDFAARRRAFIAMRALYEQIKPLSASIDSLSMGMSDDFELAIDEGATWVRIGTALFGARKTSSAPC
jgi:hypothetical protein